MTRPATEVLLGLGGNLGDPLATIETALVELEAEGVPIQARSAPYRTAPWGVTDQPDFINLCALGRTELTPEALLAAVQRVEARLGRERRERWGPRVIDIDILVYGDTTLELPGLTIPHPRLTERAFVLVPLAEIAPERVVAGRSVREWAATVDRTGVRRLEVQDRRASTPARG